MSDQNFFLFNIIIISISQIYLTVSYFIKKKPGKGFENLIIYCVTLSFLLYEHFRLTIPGFIVTCSVISIIGHTFIGLYLAVYYKSKIYDRFLHLFGAFSFSLLAFSIMDNIVPFTSEHWIYTFLLVMTLGITIGTFFEIVEFIYDSFSKGMKCQHGLADTNTDMIFNVFGSLIAAMISINIFL